MTVRQPYMMRRAGAATVALALACPAVVACGSRTPTAAPAATSADDAWAASGIDWSAPPAPGPEPAFRVPEPRRFQLDNGLTVIVVERHRLPLVSLLAVTPQGGSAHDPAGKSGLAGLTADLLDEGAGRRDAQALAGELERLGARLDVGIGADSAAIAVDTLSATLAPSLALLADVLTRPRLDAADFERIKAERLSRIAVRVDEPERVASLVLDRRLFGDHPYGSPGLGMAATVRALTLSDVRTFYRGAYAPARTTLIAVGDVDPDALRAALATTLGAWRSPGAPAPAQAPTPVAPTPGAGDHPRLVVVDKPGAEQSVVRIGRVSLTRRDPAYHVASTANTALGGSFAARLNNRLREQLGYTYGAFSRHWFGRAGGTWVVATSLETRHTVAGVREALALVAGMREAELPAPELAKATALRIGRLQQGFETNAGVAAAFGDLAVFDLPTAWYDGYGAAASAVTAAQVRDYAAQRWDPASFTVVVVGDLSRVHADLLSVFGGSVECTPEGAVVRTHTASGPAAP